MEGHGKRGWLCEVGVINTEVRTIKCLLFSPPSINMEADPQSLIPGEECIQMIIYGSKQCPDTMACRAELDARGTGYEFRDIGDLPTLKEFLHLRDTEAVFAPVRAAGGIGIPLLIADDGSLSFEW